MARSAADWAEQGRATRFRPGDPHTLAAGAKGRETAAQNAARRRLWRDAARAISGAKCTDADFLERLAAMGVQDSTVAAAILLAQVQAALSGKTDAAAFLRDTAGERPADLVGVAEVADPGAADLDTLSDAELAELAERYDARSGGSGGAD